MSFLAGQEEQIIEAALCRSMTKVLMQNPCAVPHLGRSLCHHTAACGKTTPTFSYHI